jgi:hypothetical protein
MAFQQPLPSLAEDIEAEFDPERRRHLERIFSKPDLDALEEALESGTAGMPLWAVPGHQWRRNLQRQRHQRRRQLSCPDVRDVVFVHWYRHGWRLVKRHA